MYKNILKLIFVLLSVGFAACQSVKPYQMVYVNDPEMQMGGNSGKKFEQYVESIREGATPATAAKSSGGCGCN